MRKLSILVGLLALLAVMIVPVAAQDAPTIAEIVVASATGDMPEFSTLLAAVQAADPAVLEALSNPDAELTVFAPTDAAFAALAEALGEEAFAGVLADTELLTSILLYHVVPGVVMSADVVALLEDNEGEFSAQTLNGQYIDVALTEEGGITIDDANLVLEMLDIEASNGVIHVIDAVILPESRTIADIVVQMAGMEEDAQFTLLLAGVLAANPAVLEALSDPEAELTVFAPTDAAFSALGEDTLNAVLADTELLTGILLYHVVPGNVYYNDVAELLSMSMNSMVEVETLNGASATIMATDAGVFIDNAQIVLTDVQAANGVIHVIDAVILPE
jgi:uncharacterized surface protein with fasciclin (FAS1) repeats